MKKNINITPELTNFITGFRFISETMHFIAYILDNHQRIIAVSNEFTSEFSITNKILLIGKLLTETDLPLLQFYQDNHEIISQQNLQVLSDKKHHIFFEIMDIDKFSHLYITHKYPIIVDDESIGIYVYMRPFSLQRYSDLAFCSYAKKEYCIRPWTGKYELTSKQLLVLFLFLRNYSYTEISSWLSAFGMTMSSSRVNEHLENLKIQFGAKNKAELKKKATLAGFPSLMPRGFLKSGSYLIDDYLILLKGHTQYPIVSHSVLAARLSFNVNSIASYHHDDNELISYIDAFINYYKNTDDAAYLTTYDGGTVLAKTSAYASIEDSYNVFIRSNRNHFLNTEQGSFLDILKLENECKIFVRTVIQITTITKQKLILVNCRPFHTVNIPRIMVNIFKIFSFPTTKINQKYKITGKQHMVLFFYARNYSASEVASIMTMLGHKMSLTTVNEHLKKIKLQLGISTQQQLLDAALIIAYDLIPSGLLNSGSHHLTGTNIENWIV
ncbi:helix-turn-helix transcriptional regulator [Aquella oligotrophica]|uniref:helix-turn-helix transcriptional regulator n=1 Tax=Aquella oligotrophica TaxID=2067065 RepID=UPI001315A278|nr:hypothetical protein [Aquella oligotrophica]